MSGDPKFCAEVAEKVLGFRPIQKVALLEHVDEFAISGDRCLIQAVGERCRAFAPDTDANDDLRVRDALRCMDARTRLKFHANLTSVWRVRATERITSRHSPEAWELFDKPKPAEAFLYLEYQVGDYSRAALAALKGTP